MRSLLRSESLSEEFSEELKGKLTEEFSVEIKGKFSEELIG